MIKEEEFGKSAVPIINLNRFKLFLVFYELHEVDRDWLNIHRNHLHIEYSCLGYKGKFKVPFS
jgi:hypothetical protein